MIGRLEKVSLPEFDLFNIESKIDTGAYRGSIHSSVIEEVEKDGVPTLKLMLLDEDHEEYNKKIFFVKEYKKTIVKNSIGGSEERYIISTNINLGGEVLHVDLGVSDRKEMRYPIIIGRRALKNHFIVDVSKEYIHE
jgi:hypothetical protein